jgi:hypothetical protein
MRKNLSVYKICLLFFKEPYNIAAKPALDKRDINANYRNSSFIIQFLYNLMPKRCLINTIEFYLIAIDFKRK